MAVLRGIGSGPSKVCTAPLGLGPVASTYVGPQGPRVLQARDATRGQNAQVLDTLAAIQARLGEHEKAKQNLLVAMRQVRAIDARLPLAVRLAKVHIALNEIPQANVLLEQIRADASIGRSRLERYQSDIDEIQSGIDSTRGP